MAVSTEGRIPLENASLLARQLGAVERLIHRLEQARDHLMALFPLEVGRRCVTYAREEHGVMPE